MNRKLIFFFAIHIISVSAFAQDIKKLSLTETINLGIKNSRNLQISNARIDEATAQYRQALQSRLPNLNVTGSYLKLGSANIDLASKNNSTTPPAESPKPSSAI